MKKIISILALASVLCVSAFAQEDGNRDANGNIVRGPYTVNTGFFDNTWLEVQGGINLAGSRRMGQGLGSKSIVPGFGLDVNFGKWFNPNFGMKIGWQGLGTAYKPGSTNVKESNNFSYLNAAFMINVSNWWSGYKESRVWDFVPYAHVGWINTNPNGNNLDRIGAGAGLYNKIRLSDRIGLSLDLRAIFCSNRILGQNFLNGLPSRETFMEKLGCVATAMVGVHVNLGKTNWKRVNPTINSGAGVAAGAGIGTAAVAAITSLDAENAKVEKAIKTAAANLAANKQAIADASALIDEKGNVNAAAYKGVDADKAAAYAAFANSMACPDFAYMTKSEKKEFDQNYSDILPEGWKNMSDAEKTAWMQQNIYAPVEAAKAAKAQAIAGIDTANASVDYAESEADRVVALAQKNLEAAQQKVDANGNVSASAYNCSDAQRFADIANSEACPDFTAMSRKEKRAWDKAHKDILPANWKKLTDEQKNEWVKSNIYAPAENAKAQLAGAQKDLEIAKANKAKADALKKGVAPAVATKFDKADNAGYFNTGKAKFTGKQMKNWKKSVSELDKAADYTVTGYSDPKTGSVERNAQLRRMRCAYVKNLMKKEGFTGNITAVPAPEGDLYVGAGEPDWKNKSAVIR